MCNNFKYTNWFVSKFDWPWTKYICKIFQIIFVISFLYIYRFHCYELFRYRKINDHIGNIFLHHDLRVQFYLNGGSVRCYCNTSKPRLSHGRSRRGWRMKKGRTAYPSRSSRTVDGIRYLLGMYLHYLVTGYSYSAWPSFWNTCVKLSHSILWGYLARQKRGS